MNLTSPQKIRPLIAGAILFSLLLAEVVLRLIAPQLTYSSLLSQLGSYYTLSEYNTFTLKPGYIGSEPSMEGPEKTKVTINSLGLRGPELTNDPRILMLGDSYTFGVYLSDNETFPAILEKNLRNEGYKYQVVNAGYADGHETDQQYVWLKHNIAKLKPNVVVLNVFLGNDIRFINPDAWRDIDGKGLPSKWLDNNLSVQPNGILHTTKVNIGTVGTQFIYRIPLLRNSHLCILIAKAADTAKNKLLNIPVGYYSEIFEHIFGVYSPEFLEQEKRFLKLVAAMDEHARENGAKFAVSLLPINFMIEPEKMDIVLPKSQYRHSESVYYKRLFELIDKKGIAVLDIEQAMKLSKDGPFFPQNGEVHFNRKGSAFAADKIYEFLRKGNFLEAPELSNTARNLPTPDFHKKERGG